MENNRIIVIGASSGGFEVLKNLVRELPEDFPAAIFIVWHMSAQAYGILPSVLAREGKLKAANAIDREIITPNRIYAAPPNRHLIVEPGHVRVTLGPKENRFRPAVDPLFRSAAWAYGSRVIGVILSGALDDGVAGLWTIKSKGGVTVVQDPADAEFPSMPQSALRAVKTDYCLPAREIPDLLTNLAHEQIADAPGEVMSEDKRTELEIQIAAETNSSESNIMDYGTLSPYACPDCHGVMTQLQDGSIVRFRCHTGHAFSANSLLEGLTENTEESLWNSIRAIEEIIMLLNQMGAESSRNNSELSALYFEKAHAAEQSVQALRDIIRQNEKNSEDIIQIESQENLE